MIKARELRTQYCTTDPDEIDEFEATALALGLRNHQLLAQMVRNGLRQFRDDPTHREVIAKLVAARKHHHAGTEAGDHSEIDSPTQPVVDLDERRRRRR